MPIKKKNGIRGRNARRKGSRAEIKVRNLLRTIYPPELRDRVQRVPLSGAGAIKCDVMDNNDPDSAYEVKCQESLNLNDWWRQAKFQARLRTPILVITQAYRPFYFIMHKKDWDAMRDATEFVLFDNEEEFKHPKNLMDRLASMDDRTVGVIELDTDQCVIIPQDYYLEVKESLYLSSLMEK